MGDYWRHEVRIEQFLDRDPKKTYPACTGGSGACPPEDCGGTAGYLEWRDEATGYDAWSDLDPGSGPGQALIAGFAADVLEARDAGKLTDDDRDAIQDALDRVLKDKASRKDAVVRSCGLRGGRDLGFL